LIQSTEYPTSESLLEIITMAMDLTPKVEKLERQKVAAEKSNAAKARKITDITEENNLLVHRLLFPHFRRMTFH